MTLTVTDLSILELIDKFSTGAIRMMRAALEDLYKNLPQSFEDYTCLCQVVSTHFRNANKPLLDFEFTRMSRIFKFIADKHNVYYQVGGYVDALSQMTPRRLRLLQLIILHLRIEMQYREDLRSEEDRLHIHVADYEDTETRPFEHSTDEHLQRAHDTLIEYTKPNGPYLDYIDRTGVCSIMDGAGLKDINTTLGLCKTMRAIAVKHLIYWPGVDYAYIDVPGRLTARRLALINAILKEIKSEWELRTVHDADKSSTPTQP